MWKGVCENIKFIFLFFSHVSSFLSFVLLYSSASNTVRLQQRYILFFFFFFLFFFFSQFTSSSASNTVKTATGIYTFFSLDFSFLSSNTSWFFSFFLHFGANSSSCCFMTLRQSPVLLSRRLLLRVTGSVNLLMCFPQMSRDSHVTSSVVKRRLTLIYAGMRVLSYLHPSHLPTSVLTCFLLLYFSQLENITSLLPHRLPVLFLIIHGVRSAWDVSLFGSISICFLPASFPNNNEIPFIGSESSSPTSISPTFHLDFSLIFHISVFIGLPPMPITVFIFPVLYLIFSGTSLRLANDWEAPVSLNTLRVFIFLPFLSKNLTVCSHTICGASRSGKFRFPAHICVPVRLGSSLPRVCVEWRIIMGGYLYFFFLNVLSLTHCPFFSLSRFLFFFSFFFFTQIQFKTRPGCNRDIYFLLLSCLSFLSFFLHYTGSILTVGCKFILSSSS
ncbi:unnamed protein product [Acanthosepion pharaonis]|uniref:Uncharacterized protein n=1 Tax=Acanthosepion pharaonis TaxID=158019 RepID=A0A812DE16_ACAPH|nr:unnamed protein product [Sepia pharaonis]